MTTITEPEAILAALGITDPEDLDIEAIAYHCGATILYESLTGCAANIIGDGERALITVDSNSIPSRRRFSAGHELGHWMRDRGQNAFGCTKRQIESEWNENNPETRANRFASDLLLPLSMFTPRAKGKPITVYTVTDLADLFRMSRTATAIRLVNHGSFPAMLLSYESGKRKWFVRPKKVVPESLWPHEQLDNDTVTARVSRDNSIDEGIEDVRADCWFEAPNASRYYIKESCFRTGDDSVITLLWWEDETQIIRLEEEEERKAARRSDARWGRR